MKLVFLIAPAILLIASIYLWSSGESTGALVLLAEAFIVGLILRIVLPRSYQVYEDHLQIVLGGPFSVNIRFDQINRIEVTKSMAPTINFATAITKSYVRIVKNHGLSIAITPSHYDLFTDNANRALIQWAKMKKSTKG